MGSPTLLEELFRKQLRSPLRAAGDEADDCLGEQHGRVLALEVEEFREHAGLLLRLVGLELQLAESELVALADEVLEPVARRVELEAVADAGRDERAAAAVLLYAQVARRRGLERLLELVVVESDADVVDARERPLARLDDDVDRAALELGQPELEAAPVEVVPGDAGLERRLLVVDPP